MALVQITHYNNEADSAERVVNLTGSGRSDNTEMVEPAGAPTATAAGGRPLGRCGDRGGRGRTRVRQRNTLGHNRFARCQLRRARGGRAADPRRQRFGQVDAGLDHGGPDRADHRQLPARRQACDATRWAPSRCRSRPPGCS